MRLGILVPDNLIKRLEPIKKSLNLSEEFRNMLEERALAFERAQNLFGESDITRLTEDLKKEYEILSFDWVGEGQEDAKRWCQAVGLRKIMYHTNEVLSSHKPLLPVQADILDFADRKKTREQSLFQLMDAEPDVDWYGRIRESYLLGWKSYLQAVGLLIQSELQRAPPGSKLRDTRLRVPAELPDGLKRSSSAH